MKRNFLLMLLMTLLPLAGWAQQVDLGNNYAATFAQDVTFNNGLPYVLKGAGLPEVTGFTVSTNPIQATYVPALDEPSKYKVVKKNANEGFDVVNKNNLSDLSKNVAGTGVLPVDNYFLEFQIVNAQNVTTVYVPFQVYGAGQYDYVYDEDSYESSWMQHGLAFYYAEYPWSDLGKEEGEDIILYQPNNEDWFAGKTYEQRKTWWDTDGHGNEIEEEYNRSWNIAATHPKTEPFPWIVTYGFSANDEPVKPLFKYNGTLNSANSTVYPWGDRVFGGEDGKLYGVASVSHEFQEQGWAITSPTMTTTFQVDQFELLLVPAEQMPAIPVPATTDRIDISNYYVSLPALTYNGEEQKPIFSGDGANASIKADNNSTALVEGTDFTVAFSGADYTNAGNNKPCTITGQGLYKGTKEAPYAIAQVTLTADAFELNTDVEPAEFEYDGTDKAPGVLGKVNLVGGESPVETDFTELVPGTDFDAVLTKGTSTDALTEAKNVGEYTYTITPKGNYTSQAPFTLGFAVTAIDLTNFVVDIPDYTYNTKVQKPVFTADPDANPAIVADAFVKASPDATEALVEDRDFTITYTSNGLYTDAADDWGYTITGKGNYTGVIEGTYTIAPKDIADDDVTKNIIAPTFSGEALALKQSNFDFSFNNTPLVLTTDAEAGDFTWALNTDAINPDDYESDEEYQQALEDYETSAGDKVITVTGQGNYTGTVDLEMSMKQFVITITTADANKIYGQPDPLPNFTVDANSASQVAYGGEEWQYIQGFLKMERYNNQTNEESIKENVGGHDYIIVWNPEKDPEECNYQIVIQNNTGILKIDPAPLTVTVANNSKTYGNPDPDFTADKSATEKFQILSGETDVTDAKDFVDETKNLKDVLNIDRVEGEDVKDSPYAFTWDNPNYAVTFEPTGFTINPKNIQIEIAFNQEGYEYIGKNVDPVPTVKIKNTDTELTYETDFKVEWFDGENGNTRRDVTVGNNQNGNRWPKATISQVEKGNYTFGTSQNNYYKITPATLKVEALSDNSKDYNTADPTPLSQVTFAQGFGPKGTDYFRYNAEGALETNIEFNPALVTREAGEHVGNYEISINPASKTRNYVIESTATAKFHIYLSEETIVIAFDKKGSNTTEITYEDPIDLTELISVTGPTGVDTKDLEAYAKENVKKYQYDEEAEENVYVDGFDAGVYTLTIDDAPTAFKGYTVVVNEGTLVVNPYPLYIRSVDSKEYGDEEPVDYAWGVYEYKKVNNAWKYVETERTDFTVPEADNIGNAANNMLNRYRYTIWRERGEEVGHYTTYIREYRTRLSTGRQKYYGIQYDGNYSFQFAEGDFEITRRDLTVTVTGASKFYGEYDPEKGLGESDLDENEEDNISIFQNGLIMIQIENALPQDLYDIASKVNYKDRAAGEVVTAGYQVNNVTFDTKTNPATDRYPNYNLTFDATNVKFMINKRVLKVTAHDQSVPYANPLVVDPYDLTVDGIIIGGEYQPEADINYDDIVTRLVLLGSSAPAINDRVDQVFKPLEVLEGKTAVGTFHKDAFKLELTDAAKQNYELEFTNGKVYIEQLGDIYLDMANLAQALNDHKGRTVTVHMAGAATPEVGCEDFRQFVAYQWNTLVLPFTAMPREIVAPFRYGAIDILDETNTTDGSFRLALTTRRVAANTPFLIQTDKNMRYADMKQVKWENVVIDDELDYLNEDPTATDAAGNMFKGTYKPKSDFTDANFIMRENTGEFFRFIAGEGQEAPSYAMKQTEAYLEAVNPAAGVRIFIDEEDGSTTAIDFVEGETKPINAEGAFNLSGQRVSKTQKGILIIDGKKVLVK